MIDIYIMIIEICYYYYFIISYILFVGDFILQHLIALKVWYPFF